MLERYSYFQGDSLDDIAKFYFPDFNLLEAINQFNNEIYMGLSKHLRFIKAYKEKRVRSRKTHNDIERVLNAFLSTKELINKQGHKYNGCEREELRAKVSDTFHRIIDESKETYDLNRDDREKLWDFYLAGLFPFLGDGRNSSKELRFNLKRFSNMFFRNSVGEPLEQKLDSYSKRIYNEVSKSMQDFEAYHKAIKHDDFKKKEGQFEMDINDILHTFVNVKKLKQREGIKAYNSLEIERAKRAVSKTFEKIIDEFEDTYSISQEEKELLWTFYRHDILPFLEEDSILGRYTLGKNLKRFNKIAYRLKHKDSTYY
jgi:hypothetical protein